MTSWTVYVEEEGDDMMLPLPPDLLKRMGWKEGDVLIWNMQFDKSIILTKKDNNGTE
jgi:bifunctional DNA-binding transcriptional regulator/antitoxin component of YhaV-PrlF toxin-antitoxin module